jgi:hypothetical protein
MKRTLLFIAIYPLLLVVSACDRGGKSSSADPAPVLKKNETADMPILPVKTGDSWTYEVVLEIPSDVTSPGASEVRTKYNRTRSYIGKVKAAEGLPATDCFEVTIPGSPREREFVEIHEDRILMRGSLVLRPETTQPMWLKSPVLFVAAGMRPGTEFLDLNVGDGALTRKTRVIAREEINVPAGKFACIRILTTGMDGDIELRQTRWFSPGNGIIREEKARYRQEKLIYRETQELTKLQRVSGD